MSDTSISNVMAIRAEVIARSRALREAQPTAPPGVTPTAPASTFADTLNAVVAKVNETQEQEDVVTEASEDSFPASDPPSYMAGSAIAGSPPSRKSDDEDAQTDDAKDKKKAS